MDRLGQSWDRRHTPNDGTEQFTVQSTVEIFKPVQEVWDFVTSPQTNVLLNHLHVRSFRVPDSPEGVGQQSCSLHRQANGRLKATITEVIEFEPPHRLVAKTLTGPSEILEAMIVSPTATGCTFTTSVDMLIAYGTTRKAAPAAQQALDQLTLDQLTAKVRSFVESGIRLETGNVSRESADGAGEPEAVPMMETPRSWPNGLT